MLDVLSRLCISVIALADPIVFPLINHSPRELYEYPGIKVHPASETRY